MTAGGDGALRITGSDLARARYGASSGSFSIAPDGMPACAVCGAPNGGCTSDEMAAWVVAHSQPDRWVTVTNDVWAERPSPGAPRRPMTFLAAANGQRKLLSEVVQMVAHGMDVKYRDETTAPVSLADRPLALHPTTSELDELPATTPADALPPVAPVEPEPVVTEGDPAVEAAVAAGAADEPPAPDLTPAPAPELVVEPVEPVVEDDSDLPAALRPKATPRRK